jgi:hypothetical protein
MTNTIAMVAGLATPFVTGYQSFLVCRKSRHISNKFSSVFSLQKKSSKARCERSRYTIHIVRSESFSCKS